MSDRSQTAAMDMPGLGINWGSNLQRLQRLFGGNQGRAESTASNRTQHQDASQSAVVSSSPRGLDAPMLDQHEFDHWNRGAFCGLATMVMMLQANGEQAGTSTKDLNRYAEAMYTPGHGTSGDLMARHLRKQGLTGSSFTTRGNTSRLVASLQAGQTVPLGVVMTQGEVTRIEGNRSARYPNLRPGNRHFHAFGDSGHWVLVTRFEGRPEQPTAFFVNDPDLGGELRCAPAELEAMAGGNGRYWMVEQG